jgi:hypothetical protein
MEPRDAFIAATAEVQGLTLVTRNAADFEATVKTIVPPLDIGGGSDPRSISRRRTRQTSERNSSLGSAYNLKSIPRLKLVPKTTVGENC